MMIMIMMMIMMIMLPGVCGGKQKHSFHANLDPAMQQQNCPPRFSVFEAYVAMRLLIGRSCVFSAAAKAALLPLVCHAAAETALPPS